MKMHLKLLSGVLITCSIFVFCSQDYEPKFSKPAVPYLGQKPPGDMPELFAPSIVSTDHHEHSRIAFSKDGSEIYWAVIPIDPDYQKTGESPYKSNEQNIWFSKLVDYTWTKPAVFDMTKSTSGGSPAFSAKRDLLYYRTLKIDVAPNVRPRPSQLWKVPYSKSNWGVPTHENELIPKQERKTYMSFCFAGNGNLYFDYGGPNETGGWNWHIYSSEFKDGKYLAPIKMNSGINDFNMSWCPWIAPDESYIIYSSHRDGEYGDGDLYINFKNEDGEWTDPVNMGEKVNSENQERFPAVSPDGKYLFFARNMPETFSDIYWVDAKVIEDLKPGELE